MTHLRYTGAITLDRVLLVSGCRLADKRQFAVIESGQMKHLRVFHDVARALTQTLELEEILRIIMDKMTGFFKPGALVHADGGRAGPGALLPLRRRRKQRQPEGPSHPDGRRHRRLRRRQRHRPDCSRRLPRSAMERLLARTSRPPHPGHSPASRFAPATRPSASSSSSTASST